MIDYLRTPEALAFRFLHEEQIGAQQIVATIHDPRCIAHAPASCR